VRVNIGIYTKDKQRSVVSLAKVWEIALKVASALTFTS
jgi:hypothetical protein